VTNQRSSGTIPGKSRNQPGGSQAIDRVQSSTALPVRLAAATTAAGAAEAVVDHLYGLGYELPSVYVERAGRLRCVAQRGYSQIFDGIPPASGVLGRGFTTGRTVVVRSVGEVEDYIAVVPEVAAGVCAPILVAGRTAGVVSVESLTPLSDDDIATVEQVAAQLARRFAELSPDAAESPAERLARASYALACCDSVDAIVSTASAAALELAGMSSAAVLLVDDDKHTAAYAQGPLGDLLAALPEPAVRQLRAYVETATSAYAAGHAVAVRRGFEAVAVLRDQGVRALTVLALRAVNEPVGVLVLADERPQPALCDAIPLLEMLAATAAANIGTARVRDALHRSREQLAHQAGHDALTGLPNRTLLLERLRLGEDDEPRAVLFVDLDGFKAINDAHGHAVGDALLIAVAERLTGLARDGDVVSRFGGDEFVLLCRPLRDLVDAEHVAQRVVERLAMPFRLGGVRAQLSASVGVALFHGAVDAEALLAAADRAMYVAKDAGGDGFVVTASALASG
jgi:diguanylate cyclase (GGDEF)-like protein